MDHPCRTCGACCAFFRVDFYWREANPADVPRPVPIELTEEAGPHKLRMAGTSLKRQCRCVALAGKVGVNVRCTIYENRSTPCRAFTASYENGERNPRCDLARKNHGLNPLKPEDWGGGISPSTSPIESLRVST